MHKRYLFALILLLFKVPGWAQNREKLPEATKATERLQSFNQRQKLTSNSLVQNVPFRSIGPTVMSGRIVDVEVSPTDPTHFYVAYASGGLWKTLNNGISFTPIFDQEAVMTLGDIAVDWKNNETIWVGTGENNSSRSSYAGVGIYKSSNGGKTWEYKGLPESHHIGRIVLHPSNPQVAWVAALGHLYSSNKERGLYKTTDGGQTWVQTLYVNPNAGAIDLILDPKNPDILYAATWERERRAWNFVEAGAGTGLYKSTNGGGTWVKLSTESSGFPTGEYIGRIGLALFPGNPNILYAIVDNQNLRPATDKAPANQLTKDKLRAISKAEFLALDDEVLSTFLTQNSFPKKYSVRYLKTQVQQDQLKPEALVTYLEDINAQTADRPVIGAEVYRSNDAGKTWRKTHSQYINNLYSTFGYYFGQIRVNPNVPDQVYILGISLLRSDDGGKNFTSLDADNVHADHHALWLNPHRAGHIINGNDGGLNISYDDGTHWLKANTPAVGQYYAVAVDMEKPYNVYGGLQDNGVWVGPSTYRAGVAWYQEGNYPYRRLLGGDGMQVAVDTRDNTTVYTGSQYGNYFRINRKTGERLSIQPKHELGERPLRFNWQTPVHLSRHNQDVLYLGSNKFHRSLKRGEDMQTLSGDLTNGGRPGDVGYGTLTTIDESPVKFGLLYTGSDDGVVQLSRDGGNTWTRISSKLPANLWVSRVVASAYRQGRVYVTLNGYRYDDFSPYLYVSDDYGKNWEPLGKDLPQESINVVKEDPKNARILYVGTDHGLYISFNQGKNFVRMAHNLPAVAVHDLVVHPRENELIVGTHGRSLYVASLEHVQQLTDSVLNRPLHAFILRNVYYNPNWGTVRGQGGTPLEGNLVIPYYLWQAGPVTLRVKTETGILLQEFSDAGESGLNFPTYDLSMAGTAQESYLKYKNDTRAKGEKEISFTQTDTGKQYLRPGKYHLEISANGKTIIQDLLVQGPAITNR